jgi:hypothetical protein
MCIVHITCLFCMSPGSSVDRMLDFYLNEANQRSRIQIPALIERKYCKKKNHFLFFQLSLVVLNGQDDLVALSPVLPVVKIYAPQPCNKPI